MYFVAELWVLVTHGVCKNTDKSCVMTNVLWWYKRTVREDTYQDYVLIQSNDTRESKGRHGETNVERGVKCQRVLAHASFKRARARRRAVMRERVARAHSTRCAHAHGDLWFAVHALGLFSLATHISLPRSLRRHCGQTPWVASFTRKISQVNSIS